MLEHQVSLMGVTNPKKASGISGDERAISARGGTKPPCPERLVGEKEDPHHFFRSTETLLFTACAQSASSVNTGFPFLRSSLSKDAQLEHH